MEKSVNTHTAAIEATHKDNYEKFIYYFNLKTIFELVCCFMFSKTLVFENMFPFGIAFYGAVFSKERWFVRFIVSSVSVLFFSSSDSAALYIASLMLITAILGIADIPPGRFYVSIVVSLVYFVLKLLSLIAGSFISYDILALILETALVFASVRIFRSAFPAVTAIAGRNYISTSEMISIFAFLSVGVMAVSAYELPLGFTASGVLSIFLIYVLSYGGSNFSSVILGVILGTVCSFNTDITGLDASTYAFGALLSSVLSSYGKPAIVLGFVMANTISSIFFSDASAVATGIYDSLGAALIFAFLPRRICLHISGFFSGDKDGYINTEAVLKRTQSHILSHLDEMSKSFRELSDVYTSGICEKEIGKDYIKQKFDDVIGNVCAVCPKGKVCHSKMKMYPNMSKMLETSFKYGKLTVDTMPADFKNHCHRCDSFSHKFNSVFEVIKTERQWLIKLNDSRRLISAQLAAIADSLEVQRYNCSHTFDRHCEEELMSELDKVMLWPQSVTAECKNDGTHIVSVSYDNSVNSDNTVKKTAGVISDVLGYKVNCTSPRCSGHSVTYIFTRVYPYNINVGYASETKSGEKKSGDSIKFLNYDGKTSYAILCDGMGSGEGAAAESYAAITLMEKFIYAGIDSDTAIRLINSSLLLKSCKDSFSTIDLCRCDLEKATLSFTKLGAVESYIRADNRIKRVKESALPAGIVKDIDIKTHYLSFNNETVILMLSDGIADISLKEKHLEGWIEDTLLNLKTTNPQIIASKILDKAINFHKNIAHDDMTVMVLSITKN